MRSVENMAEMVKTFIEIETNIVKIVKKKVENVI